MSAERRKVLEMVAAGTITPEEAELLLNRLSPSDGPEQVAGDDAGGDDDAERERARPPLRFLRVALASPGRDSVNIRLPLGLVRTGLNLSTLMPLKVSRRLSDRGIDLSYLGKLDDEALIAELEAHPIEIGTEKGETVRIFCE